MPLEMSINAVTKDESRPTAKASKSHPHIVDSDAHKHIGLRFGFINSQRISFADVFFCYIHIFIA